MKSAELRTGNFLKCSLTNEFLKVVEITENTFVTSVLDRSKFPLPDGWKADPIPVTEDILSKCKQLEQLKIGSYHFSIYENGFYIEINTFSKRIWINGSLLTKDAKVHELQNIVYDLTKIELSFQL